MEKQHVCTMQAYAMCIMCTCQDALRVPMPKWYGLQGLIIIRML
jgi:hypothetical protein